MNRQELHQFSFTDRIAIRRIGLEAGKPFVDELAQFSQDLIIDVLDDIALEIADMKGGPGGAVRRPGRCQR